MTKRSAKRGQFKSPDGSTHTRTAEELKREFEAIASMDPKLAKAGAAAADAQLARPVRVSAEITVEGGVAQACMRVPNDGMVAHGVIANTLLREAFGTTSMEVAEELFGQLTTLVRDRREAHPNSKALSTALAMVQAVSPRDEMEAAMAVQMTGTHFLASEMLRKARSTDDRGALETYSNLAIKLMRTQNAQLEVLAKLRAGGQQQVIVKHVYINAQNALVGDVHAAPGGGGFAEESRTQSHATGGDVLASLAFAPSAPVWSADPQREAVPVASGGGAQAMSDARGNEPGRASR